MSNTDFGYGQRQDKTNKGQGFYGAIKRPDGNISTELSVGVNLGGKETEIPLLVPGLSKQQVDYLVNADHLQKHFSTRCQKALLKRRLNTPECEWKGVSQRLRLKKISQ